MEAHRGAIRPAEGSTRRVETRTLVVLGLVVAVGWVLGATVLRVFETERLDSAGEDLLFTVGAAVVVVALVLVMARSHGRRVAHAPWHTARAQALRAVHARGLPDRPDPALAGELVQLRTNDRVGLVAAAVVLAGLGTYVAVRAAGAGEPGFAAFAWVSLAVLAVVLVALIVIAARRAAVATGLLAQLRETTGVGW